MRRTNHTNSEPTRKNVWPIAFGLFLCLAYLASAQDMPLVLAEIIEVQDGDTIDVYLLSVPEVCQETLAEAIDLASAPFVRVRLLGLGTPETDHPSIPCECHASEAKRALEALLPEGARIWMELDVQAFDGFDRLLAYAYLDEHRAFMINKLLVGLGHAISLSMAPNIKYEGAFELLEGAARGTGTGIWGSCVFGWQDAESRIGEAAVFTGSVVDTHYDTDSGMTYLNLGNPYPDPRRLTIVIPEYARDHFIWEYGAVPEGYFMQKDVSVYGRVQFEYDSPEIELLDPDRLWIIDDIRSKVVIAEVEVNPEGPDKGNEWIRLENLTDSEANIGGWLLLAKGTRPAAVRIPEGTIIPAHGHWIVSGVEYQWLDNEGELLQLLDQSGHLIDSTPPGVLDDDSNDDTTWKRMVEGG